MTDKQIEEESQELIYIIQALEGILVKLEVSYPIHTERLQMLRRLYKAVNELKSLKSAQLLKEDKEQTA